MLAESFNSHRYQLRKESDYVLAACVEAAYVGTTYVYYDFLARMQYTRTGSSDSGVAVMPFGQLDRESLAFFHEKLTELGGKPPPLPWAQQKMDKPAIGKQLNH